MPTFIYPSNAELQEILPLKVDRMVAARAGFQILPQRNVLASAVEWHQRDNIFGLQQLRGADGLPPHVKRLGQTLFSYEPGVFGEHELIGETELLRRAGSIMFPGTPIQVGDLITGAQDQLTQRMLDRQESLIWTVLTTGAISVALPGGQIGFADTFAVQTYSRNVAWTTVATATPLADFRNVQQLGVGFGIDFGTGANAWMNRVTFNMMLSNNNPADLQGRRLAFGQTVVNNLQTVQTIVGGEGLPTLNLYDEGFYNDAGTFVKYIPDGKVVTIGRRITGEPIGNYAVTRNMVNPNAAPGPYFRVLDTTGTPQNVGFSPVPPKIEIHMGHNGGPYLTFPKAVVVMTVNP